MQQVLNNNYTFSFASFFNIDRNLLFEEIETKRNAVASYFAKLTKLIRVFLLVDYYYLQVQKGKKLIGQRKKATIYVLVNGTICS